jgi:hypothetical protein
MKYWQPYGISDPDAPYINGDPSIGRQGSIPPAGSIEQDQREIVNTIKGAGMEPTASSVQQLLLAIRSQRMNYAVDTNDAVNTLQVTFIPPIANTMTPGLPLRIKPLSTNSGACTLIVDNVEHPLRRADGSELATGDIVNGIPFECMWNDGGYWAMTNYHGLPGVGPPPPPTQVITKIPYTVDVGTPGHIIANFSPSLASPPPVPGDPIEVKLTNNITGATGIVINGLPEVAVVRPNGGALQSGDGATGQVALMFRSDAGNWQFTGILPAATPDGHPGFPMPVGSIVLALGGAAPTGTLKLNGAVITRAAHPGLWAYAQASGRLVQESDWLNFAGRYWVAFSTGDGTTNFRLPDFRGEFIRCFDDGRTADPGRVLYQQQPDGIGPFNVTADAKLNNPFAAYTSVFNPGLGELGLSPFSVTNESGGGSGYGGYQTGAWYLFVSPNPYTTGVENIYGIPSSGYIRGNMEIHGSGGANETRARNSPVMACVVDG